MISDKTEKVSLLLSRQINLFSAAEEYLLQGYIPGLAVREEFDTPRSFCSSLHEFKSAYQELVRQFGVGSIVLHLQTGVKTGIVAISCHEEIGLENFKRLWYQNETGALETVRQNFSLGDTPSYCYFFAIPHDICHLPSSTGFLAAGLDVHADDKSIIVSPSQTCQIPVLTSRLAMLPEWLAEKIAMPCLTNDAEECRTKRNTKEGIKVLEQACTYLRKICRESKRDADWYHALYQAAVATGQAVAGGEIVDDIPKITARFTDLARSCSLSLDLAKGYISTGLAAGQKHPIQLSKKDSPNGDAIQEQDSNTPFFLPDEPTEEDIRKFQEYRASLETAKESENFEDNFAQAKEISFAPIDNDFTETGSVQPDENEEETLMGFTPFALEEIHPGLRGLPPIPLQTLPVPVQAVMKNAAAAYETDYTIPLAAVLCAVSTAVGRSAVLSFNGHENAAHNWISVICDSGGNKSKVTGIFMKEIVKRQQEIIVAYNDALDEWQKEKDEYVATRMSRQKENLSTNDLVEPQKPMCPRFYVQDTTPEAITPILKDNPEGVTWVRDEIASLFGDLKRYQSQGSSRDSGFKNQLLSSYDAQPLEVTRVKDQGKTIVIPHASIGLFGTIQPARMATLFSREDLDSGFFPRFMFLVSDPPPPVRHPAKINSTLFKEWDNIIGSLIDWRIEHSGEGRQPVSVSMSLKSEDIINNFFYEFMSAAYFKRTEEGLNAYSTIQAARWRGQFARLLLGLHFLRIASDKFRPACDFISDETVSDAIELFHALTIHSVEAWKIAFSEKDKKKKDNRLSCSNSQFIVALEQIVDYNRDGMVSVCFGDPAKLPENTRKERGKKVIKKYEHFQSILSVSGLNPSFFSVRDLHPKITELGFTFSKRTKNGNLYIIPQSQFVNCCKMAKNLTLTKTYGTDDFSSLAEKIGLSAQRILARNKKFNITFAQTPSEIFRPAEEKDLYAALPLLPERIVFDSDTLLPVFEETSVPSTEKTSDTIIQVAPNEETEFYTGQKLAEDIAAKQKYKSVETSVPTEAFKREKERAEKLSSLYKETVEKLQSAPEKVDETTIWALLRPLSRYTFNQPQIQAQIETILKGREAIAYMDINKNELSLLHEKTDPETLTQRFEKLYGPLPSEHEVLQFVPEERETVLLLWGNPEMPYLLWTELDIKEEKRQDYIAQLQQLALTGKRPSEEETLLPTPVPANYIPAFVYAAGETLSEQAFEMFVQEWTQARKTLVPAKNDTNFNKIETFDNETRKIFLLNLINNKENPYS